MPKAITTQFPRRVFDLVRVIIPDELEHKYEYGFHSVRHPDPKRDNVWLDLKLAAALGLVRVETIVQGETTDPWLPKPA